MHWQPLSQLSLVCLLTVLFVITSFLPVHACFSIIVGKDASETGEVILAHNEDNGGPLVMPQYKVPRQKHSAGEILVLENTAAKIPQVPETWSYFWSETRSPAPGASFSDFFINEWGVAVTSDNCPSREDAPSLTDGGIGYGIRKIIAERAKSAREGVEIAIKLVGEYGYNAAGRSYQIADKKEGWMLQLVNGKHYVARRVGDDEVALIPNHYTIRQVAMNDTTNYRVSPDLISYALARGWYTPAQAGNYSDFDFAKAYQTPERYQHPVNIYRHQHALEILLNRPVAPEDFPFAVKPAKKLGMDTIKKILRTHYEGTPDDLSNGYKNGSPHYTGRRVICAATTQQSFIVQFRDNPDFTVIWNALGHPCTSAYVPWYLGMTKIPDGFGWLTAQPAQDSHFSASPDDLSYNPRRAWWIIQDLQNIAEPNYGQVIAELETTRDKLETKFINDQPAFENKARNIYKQNAAEGKNCLTQYTNAQAQFALAAAKELYNKLNTVTIAVQTDTLSKNGQGPVFVTIYSNKYFYAPNIDTETLRLGSSFRDCNTDWAKEQFTLVKDVNNDGLADVIAAFNIQDVIKYEIPRRADLWLTGKTKDGKVIAARSIVEIR